MRGTVSTVADSPADHPNISQLNRDAEIGAVQHAAAQAGLDLVA
jgi:hypothetical protein